MEQLGDFFSTAMNYITQAASQSETLETAQEELLSGFWTWMRPRLIPQVPTIETAPESEQTQTAMEEQLAELIRDDVFFNALVNKITALQQAGIREKNIVRQEIRRAKKVHIGDREYRMDEPFDRKNIVEGAVEDVEEFRLGDG